MRKSYIGEVVLGVETTTLDDAGEVVAAHDMTGVTLQAVREAAAAFVGEIEQVPPMVSSVKVGGQRLHRLARAGVVVAREPRRVTVHRFGVEAGTQPAVFPIEVECSSGTYVRALAADLGRRLGGGAHLRALRRTAIGSFTLAEALPLGRLEQLRTTGLRPPEEAVRDLERVLVDAADAARVGHGAVLERSTLAVDAAAAGPFAVFDAAGTLLAVYEPHLVDPSRLKPAMVLGGPPAPGQ